MGAIVHSPLVDFACFCLFLLVPLRVLGCFGVSNVRSSVFAVRLPAAIKCRMTSRVWWCAVLDGRMEIGQSFG